MAWLIATLMIIALVLIVNANAKKPSVSSKRYKDSPKYQKLLRLVGGERETADRLIDRFGIDKAIYDLERDRRI